MAYCNGARQMSGSFRALMILTLALTALLSACAGPANAPDAAASNQTAPNQPPGGRSTKAPFMPVTATAVTNGQKSPNQSAPKTAAQNGAGNQAVFKGPLSVTITSLVDNSVVHSTPIDVLGQADPGTVISINDAIATAGKDRKFSLQVPLDAGLNVLEVTASDLQGNQDTVYLTVTNEP